MIIAESFLSFLGLGVQPPIPSWGGMLAEGRAHLLSMWWLATLPGIAIFASAITKNQITAFIIGFMLCFTIYIAGKITVFLPTWLMAFADFIGTDTHLNNLTRGIIDSRDIIYYASISGFFIFLTYIKLMLFRND